MKSIKKHEVNAKPSFERRILFLRRLQHSSNVLVLPGTKGTTRSQVSNSSFKQSSKKAGKISKLNELTMPSGLIVFESHYDAVFVT